MLSVGIGVSRDREGSRETLFTAFESLEATFLALGTFRISNKLFGVGLFHFSSSNRVITLPSHGARRLV